MYQDTGKRDYANVSDHRLKGCSHVEWTVRKATGDWENKVRTRLEKYLFEK